jgi:mRNA-degrading endonuclease RelE of RelBE toxin-antitoxin system
VVKYSLEIKQSAQKELDALDDAAVHAHRPEDSGAGRHSPARRMQKAERHKDQWRVRVGDWRVLYIIDGAAAPLETRRGITSCPGRC